MLETDLLRRPRRRPDRHGDVMAKGRAHAVSSVPDGVVGLHGFSRIEDEM